MHDTYKLFPLASTPAVRQRGMGMRVACVMLVRLRAQIPHAIKRVSLWGAQPITALGRRAAQPEFQPAESSSLSTSLPINHGRGCRKSYLLLTLAASLPHHAKKFRHPDAVLSASRVRTWKRRAVPGDVDGTWRGGR